MMWNYLVSGLLVDATIVLYDGAPNAPDLGALWRLAAEEGVTLFGTSAPYLMACRKEGLRPGEEADLSALRGHRLDRRPAAGRGIPLRARRHRRPRSRCSRSPAGPMCAPPSWAPPRSFPSGRARSAAATSAARSRPSHPRAAPLVGEQGELVLTAADAVHAGRVLGRRRRVALPRRVLRRLPRHVAPRRLDHVHRAWLVRHQRPLGRDPQPWRRADRHRGVLRGRGVTAPRSPTRSSCTSRRATTWSCSLRCARAPRSTSCARGSQPLDAVAAPRARRDRPCPPSRARCRARSSRCR